MWDDKRKVGILNDFDLARFADQDGASGQDNTGTLPFMALDLLSKEGLRGEIPRRYRHEAESFAWSLICLCLATVEDKNGRNCTISPHPLQKWFTDWGNCFDAKFALQWRNYDNPDIPLVHSNTKLLASALHDYWLGRYTRQFPPPPKVVDRPPLLGGAFGIEVSAREESSYEEPEDDSVFREVLVEHEVALRPESLQEVRDYLVKMGLKFQKIDWDA